MRKAMQDWLKKRKLPEINPDDIQGLCNKLGLEGDKHDGCLALVWQMEKGDINETEFLGGLSVIAGKEPEEVAGVLKGKDIESYTKAKVEERTKKIIEPFNIHLDAFWKRDLRDVERMIRKLDSDTLKKLYGMTIEVRSAPTFPHPTEIGRWMLGDTRYFRDKPYLIILGSETTPRILYHEVAHAIGIDDETEAMEFAIQKERALSEPKKD